MMSRMATGKSIIRKEFLFREGGRTERLMGSDWKCKWGYEGKEKADGSLEGF